MSTSTVTSGVADLGSSDARTVALEGARFWWLWLVTGIVWIIAALVILQFDTASVRTIGVIVGCMFVFTGVQQFVAAGLVDRWRWVWVAFGVLMVIAGILCFINPEATFVGFADMLGFLFVLVGVWWTIEAFLAQDENPLWWFGLVSGVLMFIMGFWTSGQFFIEKAYTLLIFAGIWGLMHGVGDIVRAFQMRKLREVI